MCGYACCERCGSGELRVFGMLPGGHVGDCGHCTRVAVGAL